MLYSALEFNWTVVVHFFFVGKHRGKEVEKMRRTANELLT